MFYLFVHSFICLTKDSDSTIAVCNYSDISIPAVIATGNVFGCQFHPEKSQNFGQNFLTDKSIIEKIILSAGQLENKSIIVFKQAPIPTDIFFGSAFGETLGTFDISTNSYSSYAINLITI